jgi:hypothetical protein
MGAERRHQKSASCVRVCTSQAQKNRDPEERTVKQTRFVTRVKIVGRTRVDAWQLEIVLGFKRSWPEDADNRRAGEHKMHAEISISMHGTTLQLWLSRELDDMFGAYL